MCPAVHVLGEEDPPVYVQLVAGETAFADCYLGSDSLSVCGRLTYFLFVGPYLGINRDTLTM